MLESIVKRSRDPPSSSPSSRCRPCRVDAAAQTFATLSGTVVDPTKAFCPRSRCPDERREQGEHEVRTDRDRAISSSSDCRAATTRSTRSSGLCNPSRDGPIAGQNVQRDMTMQVGSSRRRSTIVVGPPRTEAPRRPDSRVASRNSARNGASIRESMPVQTGRRDRRWTHRRQPQGAGQLKRTCKPQSRSISRTRTLPVGVVGGRSTYGWLIQGAARRDVSASGSRRTAALGRRPSVAIRRDDPELRPGRLPMNIAVAFKMHVGASARCRWQGAR